MANKRRSKKPNINEHDKEILIISLYVSWQMDSLSAWQWKYHIPVRISHGFENQQNNLHLIG
jgi:hypothetical protein